VGNAANRVSPPLTLVLGVHGPEGFEVERRKSVKLGREAALSVGEWRDWCDAKQGVEGEIMEGEKAVGYRRGERGKLGPPWEEVDER
jgi:hypothetical protein